MDSGDTLLVTHPNASVDSHLWMVISDPTQSERVLLVNFTSWRADKDQACILNPGDHSYISRKTCVNYKDAKTCESTILDKLVKNGEIKTLAPLKPEILEQIRNSVPDSWISQDNAQFLVDQGLVDI